MGTSPPNDDLPKMNDKLAHAVGFGVLAALLLPAVARGWPSSPLRFRDVVVSAACATAIGGVLELWQALLSFRRAEWYDLLADAAGAVIALSVASLVLGWVGQKHRERAQ